MKLNYLDFFNTISKKVETNKVIDIDELSSIVNMLEKDKKLSDFSSLNQVSENYEKYKAPEILAQI